MKRPTLRNRTMALLAVLSPLLALFLYVAFRSGPLAPVPVTVTPVENRALSPALFGIGTVEARHPYKIGPVLAGRVRSVEVQVGDQVRAGQILGTMDPVDLDERISAQEAALKRGQALLGEARAHQAYARQQAGRYEQLLAARSISEETLAAKIRDLQAAEAASTAAEQEYARLRADGEALLAQRRNLNLVAPADGLVTLRDAEPGTTVVAGQAVVEMIDPKSLWVNVRFDQIHAGQLAPMLPARITLRSRAEEQLPGRVSRVEPLADAVTEEILAKVVFDRLPEPLPPVGELAEITITLPPLAEEPVIPHAALHRRDGKLGVWRIDADDLRFIPVLLGRADLEGNVQVRKGLATGEKVVVYSADSLHARSRVRVVDRIPGVPP